ncbi:MAG: benzoate/H(+) symporter BenE family transporter [Pseudomonadota bacterium]
MPLEKPALPLPRQPWSDFGTVYAGNAFVAFLFSSSGPVAIILSVGARGGLTESDLASWIFAVFFLNGLITIAFSLLYRQPLAFFWTIPGTVLVGPALTHLTFPEVIGAFLATGVLMLALALTAVPRLARLAPPLIVALITGAIAIWWLGAFNPPAGTLFEVAKPNFYAPQFSWQAMVELVVPLAITVLVVQNGQGIAILTASGHRPPVNAITFICGVGSLVTACFGAVSTCLTGPSNAILASSGEKHRQYTAAIFLGILALGFGLTAPFFTRLLLATPPAFIATLAGLAMLRVLQTSFQISFRDKFSFGALICFVITVADVPIFRIGAPFWGLVFGIAASRLLERDDFMRNADRPARASWGRFESSGIPKSVEA